MTQRLAFWPAILVGLLAVSCSSAPSDQEYLADALEQTAISTVDTSADHGQKQGEETDRTLLRVEASTANPTTGTAPSAADTPATTASSTTIAATATTTTASSTTSSTSTAAATAPAGRAGDGYFATVAVGGTLPTGAACAAAVTAQSSGREVRPENGTANATTSAPSVDVDGADQTWNSTNAARVTGGFTGTTEDILRWGACKWGFDEDVTRARAVAESSWSINTEGDRTSDQGLCATMGLDAPCNQSYGLLQVKGSVHDGTFPASKNNTAFGVDYAMAWLRACYDGAMGWLGNGYQPGDEWGCVGAWFSGQWKDAGANDYIGKVRGHLDTRVWEGY